MERLRIKDLMLTIVFAVVYSGLRLVPTFPIVGAPGAFFASSDILAPIYGVVLGPAVAPLSVTLGTFLSFAFGRAPIFLGLDFLPAAANAAVVGMLMKGRRGLPIACYAIALALFSLHPYTSFLIRLPSSGVAVPFAWMHFLGLAILISPLSRKAAGWAKASTATRLFPAVAILAFIGTLVQHSVGSLLFETILGSYMAVIKPEAFPTIWAAVFYLYPVERASIVLLASLVGTGLIKALKALGSCGDSHPPGHLTRALAKAALKF